MAPRRGAAQCLQEKVVLDVIALLEDFDLESTILERRSQHQLQALRHGVARRRVANYELKCPGSLVVKHRDLSGRGDIVRLAIRLQRLEIGHVMVRNEQTEEWKTRREDDEQVWHFRFRVAIPLCMMRVMTPRALSCVSSPTAVRQKMILGMSLRAWRSITFLNSGILSIATTASDIWNHRHASRFSCNY